MIRSMTGFASTSITIASGNNEKANISINIKSLNSRFFEATCKLHYQINALETELVQLLKKKLIRGHVYLTVYIDNQNVFTGAIAPSFSTIDGYVKAIGEIKQKFSIAGDLSVDDLLMLPNVFIIEEKTINDAHKKAILDAVSRVIEELITNQEKEGESLLADIEKRIQIMEKEIGAIEQASVTLVQLQKEKVAAALKETMLDDSKFAELHKNAAYALLDKIDIHEEIIRFKSHIKNLKSQLLKPDMEKGKRLDFTLQELAREINTIAAKCSDATMSNLAINIKVELEKAREQVQNIV